MRSHQFNRIVFINALWSFIGRFGAIAISLITNIILVRLLSPKEFGQVSIIMFFIIISSVLIESGLAGALVRQENTDETDYSTVFLFNLFISIILMLSLFFCATFIANYYNDNELINLLKLASFVLIFNSLRIVQSVKLIRSLKFKSKSIYEIISYTIAAFVAIYMAIQDYGPVALIMLELLNSIVLTILLWYFVGPLKTLRFSYSSFLRVFKFGVNTTLASLLNQIFENIYQLILAKYFSISQSGLFYQAKKIQGLPIGIIQGSVLNVIYSALSKLQNSVYEFNKLYSNVMKIFAISIAFLCILIFCYADSIIYVLYGSEWIESSKYLKVLIVAAFFSLQETLNSLVFKVFDRTDLLLKLEIFKKFLLSITIIYGVWALNINYLLYGYVLTSIIGFLMNYWYLKKIYAIDYWAELTIIFKIIVISVVTITITDFFCYIIQIEGYMRFALLPLIIIVYCIALILTKVVDIRNDIKSIRDLLGATK